MDEPRPAVFQPGDAEGEYAIVVDTVFEASVLRDALQQAAQVHLNRAAKAVHGTIRTRNEEKHFVLAKYAERFEYVRQCEAARIVAKLDASQR